MRILIAALLLGAASPVAAQQAAKPDAEKADSNPDKKKDDFDMAQVMAMFDKLFPAQPEPAPQRLALARFTATGMLPNGVYADLFDDVMSGVVDRVLSINPADFGKDGKGKSASATSLRQEMAKDDPHFEERMRIMQRVVREELIKVSAVMEPKLRDGLARSIARRFDEKQLKEINAFLATDSGKALRRPDHADVGRPRRDALDGADVSARDRRHAGGDDAARGRDCPPAQAAQEKGREAGGHGRRGREAPDEA